MVEVLDRGQQPHVEGLCSGGGCLEAGIGHVAGGKQIFCLDNVVRIRKVWLPGLQLSQQQLLAIDKLER